MSAISIRMPISELDALRVEAQRRSVSTADLIRAALRSRHHPIAWATVSAGCQNTSLTMSTDTPLYVGGVGTPVEFTSQPASGTP